MNKNEKILYIIIKTPTDKDLVKIQEIGIENDYRWPSSGKVVAYRDIELYRTIIHFILFDIKARRMFYKDDPYYLDIFEGDLNINTDECIILENTNELEKFFKYGIIIDYNEPKKLVYENNNGDNCSEICVFIKDSDELKKLSDLYKSFFNTIKCIYDSYNHNVNNGLYIFLNIKSYSTSFLSPEYKERYELNNDILPKNQKIFDGVYYKVFHIRKDFRKIKDILTLKMVVEYPIINYNDQKKLVYESNLDKIDEICIKIDDDKELEELEEMYTKYLGRNHDFDDYYSDDSDDSDDSDYDNYMSLKPIYLFINFKEKAEISYESFDFNFDSILNDSNYNEVYKKLFNFKSDKYKIDFIFKYKKINIVDYNEPKNLVYEGKLNSKYKYRFKTEQEFINEYDGDWRNEYGDDWRYVGNYYFINRMDYLFGKIIDPINYEYLLNKYGKLDFTRDFSFHVKKENESGSWTITPYMIKEISIDYNKPRQLVYENNKKINKINKYIDNKYLK